MAFFGVLMLFALPAALVIASTGFAAASWAAGRSGLSALSAVLGVMAGLCLAALVCLAMIALRALIKKKSAPKDGAKPETEARSMSNPIAQVINCMLAMQRFPWEQGVCAQALYEAGRSALWVPMARDAIMRAKPDGRLAMAGGNRAVSDPAVNGEVCLRAWEKTNDPYFRDGAEGMLHYLIEKAPRTADNIICHNEPSLNPDGSENRELWIDGLYMAPPFLAVMGRLDEAYEQVEGYYRHLFDEESGLFYHIRDVQSDRFTRKKRWATGNGWALMGLCRIAEAAKAQGRDELYADIGKRCLSLADAMSKYQLEDGRFPDILDEASFPDGTSALMFAAAIYRGALNGYIDEELLPLAERAYQGTLQRIDGIGLIHGVCGCPDFKREGTSAEAQAAFVMAHAWREKYRKKAG